MYSITSMRVPRPTCGESFDGGFHEGNREPTLLPRETKLRYAMNLGIDEWVTRLAKYYIV